MVLRRLQPRQTVLLADESGHFLELHTDLAAASLECAHVLCDCLLFYFPGASLQSQQCASMVHTCRASPYSSSTAAVLMLHSGFILSLQRRAVPCLLVPLLPPKWHRSCQVGWGDAEGLVALPHAFLLVPRGLGQQAATHQPSAARASGGEPAAPVTKLRTRVVM